ncbi:MAG: NifU family protein [Bacteroidota bacterium]|nr:NifU family protein [Bacteroidota bacterium]
MNIITDPDILNKIEEALAQLRPFLNADGGDMELVEVTSDFIVKVKLVGACSSCSMSAMTLKNGVEEAVKKAVPQIKGIEAVIL